MDPIDINIAKRISRIHYESAVELFQDKKYQVEYIPALAKCNILLISH